MTPNSPARGGGEPAATWSRSTFAFSEVESSDCMPTRFSVLDLESPFAQGCRQDTQIAKTIHAFNHCVGKCRRDRNSPHRLGRRGKEMPTGYPNVGPSRRLPAGCMPQTPTPSLEGCDPALPGPSSGAPQFLNRAKHLGRPPLFPGIRARFSERHFDQVFCGTPDFLAV